MRRATRILAASFGIFAGFGGLEHGYFEILQGNARPDSMMIASMGPPCVPEAVWHACEPAMTIVPNFLFTGLLAVALGAVTIAWSALFVQRRYGPAILVLLSLALLLLGGGLIPPLIGFIGALMATRINKPLKARPVAIWAALARLWPWPLIVLFGWLFGQLLFGRLINDWLMASGLLFPAALIGLLALSVLVAYAWDVLGAGPVGVPPARRRPAL
jgi:hypothetical protein